MKGKLKKFNLEESIASGSLKITEGGFVDLSNITLLDKKEDYLIHIEYLPQQNKPVFAVYKKKK